MSRHRPNSSSPITHGVAPLIRTSATRARTVLGRRTLLRGMAAGGGVILGLPLFEAMLDENGTALADGNDLPMRFVSWFLGNGVRLQRFEPSTVGAGWQANPSEELAPLGANLLPYVNVCTGLQNWCPVRVTHHEGMTAFNGYTMTEVSGLFSKAGGPTIDQVIADRIAGPTAVKSIQIGVSKRVSIMDSGTTMHSLSHRSANEPLYPEFNPQKVYERLFSEFEPKPDDRALRLAVLDAVREDAKRLQGRLGSMDRARLEAHLTAVGELESKINTLPPSCVLPSLPSETNQDVAGVEPVTSVNDAMSDLLAYAFECDVTRVASVFFIGGAAETTFTEIGQNVGHHYNTHDSSAQEAVHQGVVYAMQRFATFLEKLRQRVEPAGDNLLDTSIVLLGSDCSEGLTHSISRQPMLLAGHGRNKLAYPGVHHQSTPYGGTSGALAAAGNTSDVLYTCLKAFDPTATSVGDMVPKNRPNGTWFGTSNPPAQVVVGSSTTIPALHGSAWEG